MTVTTTELSYIRTPITLGIMLELGPKVRAFEREENGHLERYRSHTLRLAGPVKEQDQVARAVADQVREVLAASTLAAARIYWRVPPTLTRCWPEEHRTADGKLVRGAGGTEIALVRCRIFVNERVLPLVRVPFVEEGDDTPHYAEVQRKAEAVLVEPAAAPAAPAEGETA